MHSIVEQNLRAAMRCYALIGDGSEARDYPGLTVASSGLDVPVFNSAMLTASTDDIERFITTADVHFRSRKLGWTFWVCEDLIPKELRGLCLRAIFSSRGMRCIAEAPGIYAESLLQPLRSPAQMTFGRVSSAETRLEFAHLASVVFALRFEVSKRIYGAPGVWQPPSYGWIGYLEGKAVAIVTIVIADGVLGVYSLGTLPQHQGCGYGETLLRHALSEARKESGIERSVLQATAQGLSLYRRMGYRIVTRFSIYLREGCATF
jgi:ribosomal protein S18 acetylase RimI-like enzyme